MFFYVETKRKVLHFFISLFIFYFKQTHQNILLKNSLFISHYYKMMTDSKTFYIFLALALLVLMTRAREWHSGSHLE